MIDSCAPLINSELKQVDEILRKYGNNDDAVMSASELDGFFIAVISSPRLITQDEWLPALWGGEDKMPQWDSVEESLCFMDLCQRHWNYLADTLRNDQQGFLPLLLIIDGVVDASHWSFGYMYGVTVAKWSEMPSRMQKALDVIGLHGLEENYPRVDALTPEQLQASIKLIDQTVIKIYNHWLPQRPPQTGHSLPPTVSYSVVKSDDKTGRNDPCPCGSGKKFKKCCLH